VKSPDYSTTNAVVLLGASPSFISQREGAVTVGTREIKEIANISYTFWYVDISGWANLYFRFLTSEMTINQWHWVVVNQDSTNGIQLFVDGVPGTPTGSVNDISAPAGARFVSGTNTGGKQLYFFDDPARRASNGKMLVNGSYQIGAWFGKRYGDQKRDTIGGASFGDIRYTAPSIYSSASTSLTVPTSAPSALAGTQLLLTSGNSTNGMTDESGNQQLEFVNVSTSRAGAPVSGWTTLQTQSALNLTTTTATVNTLTTLTTSGGSGSGGISFVVNSGPCTISSGNQLTASAAGTCVVAATKANDGTYNSTSVTGNITVSATAPVQISAPPTQQQSEIFSINPLTCYVGVPTEFIVSGRFIEAIGNISTNQTNLPVNSWRQDGSKVTFTFTASDVGEQIIQLYNGSIPLLTPLKIKVLAKPVNSISVETPNTSANTQPTSSMKKIATIKFSVGASAITSRQEKQLASIAQLIRESSFTSVLLYGHSDIQPGVDNVLLSKKRAKSVQASITPLLEGLNIKLGWFAATKPAVMGNSQSAYAKNRRVEVWVN
jgi:outer membrane protein OmpA-like peptidoglycan-associated protein